MRPFLHPTSDHVAARRLLDVVIDGSVRERPHTAVPAPTGDHVAARRPPCALIVGLVHRRPDLAASAPDR
jgi:hypothetical protein